MVCGSVPRTRPDCWRHDPRWGIVATVGCSLCDCIQLTSQQRLIVSTGYFRHGILLAAFGARCTRELVLGEDPSIDLSACDPLRFAR